MENNVKQRIAWDMTAFTPECVAELERQIAEDEAEMHTIQPDGDLPETSTLYICP